MPGKEANNRNQTQPETETKARSVLEMSALEARNFFLKGESYRNMDLPSYFVFDNLLRFISEKIKNRKPGDFYDSKELRSKSSEELNHTIFNNKDGKYAWRPLQLINPFLYVALANEVTGKAQWGTIKKRFRDFSGNGKIECASCPVESPAGQKDRTEQISFWWENLEQRSVSLALDYEYLIHTDISYCYGSIYTHSIAWALHGKDKAQRKRQENGMIGNLIDKRIQDMRGGQRSGIPQGAVLMDFVAEMVLGYVDLRLSGKTDKKGIEDYRILRYRDDYRIFTNNPREGEAILKLLTEELTDLGVRINSSEALVTDEVIRESIKPDKLFWIGQKQKEKDFRKQLLIIHDLARRSPNSGSLVTSLNDYYERIPPSERRSAAGDEEVTRKIKKSVSELISIITDITYRNPRVYHISSAILSKFICLVDDDREKKEIITKIERRLGQIPNIGHLQIWLQRVTVKFDRSREYEEKLCGLVQRGVSGNRGIWDFSWLRGRLGGEIGRIGIIDEERIEELPPFVEKEEVELFRSDY